MSKCQIDEYLNTNSEFCKIHKPNCQREPIYDVYISHKDGDTEDCVSVCGNHIDILVKLVSLLNREHKENHKDCCFGYWYVIRAIEEAYLQ